MSTPIDFTESLISLGLQEDLGTGGDLTSDILFENDQMATASIVAKEDGTLAGVAVATGVFKSIDPDISVQALKADSDTVAVGDKVMCLEGRVRSVLRAERTALNFMQKLSGIASLTAKYVSEVGGTEATILDTRKTTPGYRYLEKQAVRMGGGSNHRFGLYDMILIKENHIEAAGSLSRAVRLSLDSVRQAGTIRVEVEVRNLTEVREALAARPDRILLDNMTLPEIRQAVQLADGAIEIEVSGGVMLDTVRQVAETGVDYISVGAITHSAPPLDLSLLIN